jgi:hypothetical protein
MESSGAARWREGESGGLDFGRWCTGAAVTRRREILRAVGRTEQSEIESESGESDEIRVRIVSVFFFLCKHVCFIKKKKYKRGSLGTCPGMPHGIVATVYKCKFSFSYKICERVFLGTPIYKV